MAERVNRSILNRGLRTTGVRFRIGLAGGLWAGFVLALFTFNGGKKIFMEQPLSLNHRGLEKNCGNCHESWEGVAPDKCASCHTQRYDWSKSPEYRQQYPAIPYKKDIHFSSGKFDKKGDCLSCHPEECHIRDYSLNPPLDKKDNPYNCTPDNRKYLKIPQKMDNYVCAKCHPDGCQRAVTCADCHKEHRDGMLLPVNRPGEVFMGKGAVPMSVQTPRGKLMNETWTEQTVLNWEKTRARMSEQNCMACHPKVLHRQKPTPEEVDASRISRTIFRHDSPGHRKYWHCTECHRTKFPLRRNPEENIFTMEACAKRCHYADDCAGCHRFHDPIAKKGEHVDWPERLKTYDRLVGIESPNATAELPVSTKEFAPPR